MLNKIGIFLQRIEGWFLVQRFKLRYQLNLVKPTYLLDKRRSDRTLTFEDMFELGELDRTKWNTAERWGRAHKQTNSYTTDGDNLHFFKNLPLVRFLVKEESGTSNEWFGEFHYDFTRVMLTSRDKHEQLYGRFEICAKMSNNKRCWPAFWLLNPAYETQDGFESIMPEIDVFEHFGGESRKRKDMHFTLHWGGLYDAPTKDKCGTKIKRFDFEDFFVYSVEWTEKSLKWYVNDELIKVFRLRFLKGDDVPKRPMYMLVNNSPNREHAYNFDDKLPDGMTVDWIRTYEKK